MAKLTAKQKTFVNEYLVDLNATQAAIRAGYSEKTAYRTGADNLRKPQIQIYIQEAMKEREKRTEITQDRVLKEYAKIAFFNPKNLFSSNGQPKDIAELDDDTAAVIAGLDVNDVYEGFGDDRTFIGYLKKYKLADKKGALDSLARHLGMFNDKLEISGQVNNPFDGISTEDIKKALGKI